MTVRQLEQKLSRTTGRRIRVVLTNNRHRVLSYHPERDQPATLRLSRMFLGANTEVLRALAAFIKGSQRAKRVLQAYVDRQTERLARRRARQGIPVHTRGQYFDLQQIFDQLNFRYFAGGVDAYITWGRRRQVPGKQSVQLGTYSEAERLIRINPVLDQARVPRHVVEKVVFHEMLHHVLTPRRSARRRCLHTKEFLESEQRYARYAEAERWLKRNMRVVLG